MNVDWIMDWAPIEKLLKRKLRRNRDAVGDPAYPALGMFKVLLLRRWYNLSDQGMDDALADRISFRRFVGFSFDYDTPDATKRDYVFPRARYLGCAKVKLEFLLNAVAFNLKKAALMVGLVCLESEKLPRTGPHGLVGSKEGICAGYYPSCLKQKSATIQARN